MILAGGKGTRFAEYTDKIPKPMILANGKPLLDHIISIYSKYEIKNVIVLAGYKIEKIVEHYDNVSERISDDEYKYLLQNNTEVTILDSGLDTMTGGRVRKGIDYLNEENFYLTYGDGIADVNLEELTDFHNKQKTTATVTAVRPPARFGSLEIENEKVVAFNEKKYSNEGWINGGFFILNKSVKEYINEGNQSFEKEPLSKISNENKLIAYKHEGLFRPVDTIRELEILEAELKANEFDFDYE